MVWVYRRQGSFLAGELVYVINMDIKHTLEQYVTSMECQEMQPHEKIIPYKMLHIPWEVIHYKNNTLLCIVDYYSKFPVVKKTNGLSADNMFGVVKILFAKFGLPKKIVSDAGTNFTSGKFRQFCRQLNIEWAITSSCHHQSN